MGLQGLTADCMPQALHWGPYTNHFILSSQESSDVSTIMTPFFRWEAESLVAETRVILGSLTLGLNS